MGLLRVKIDNSNVRTSYMGSEPKVSPMNDAWIAILKSIYLGGDTIDITDERAGIPEAYGNLTVTYNTDTGARSFPDSKEFDIDDIIKWLEDHPDEMSMIKDKMRQGDTGFCTRI